jgi:hypothetical protein
LSFFNILPGGAGGGIKLLGIGGGGGGTFPNDGGIGGGGGMFPIDGGGGGGGGMLPDEPPNDVVSPKISPYCPFKWLAVSVSTYLKKNKLSR